MRADAGVALELRREPRRPATGTVLLRADTVAFEGKLVDVSESGFRVLHKAANLERGVLLRFRHEFARGHARVVWNRIMGGEVESGFNIVEREG